MSHALLSASGSGRWINCPPSARLESKFPAQPSSAYAQEGTDAHALAEKKLKAWTLTGKFQKFECHDDDMDSYTDSYVRFVVEKLLEARVKCPDAQLFIEQRLDYSQWVPNGFGTGDAVIIADGMCTIIDLKYGRGVHVEAEDNPQLKLYAAGALDTFSELYSVNGFELIIYQPRLKNISRFEISSKELVSWLDTVIKPTAELAFAGKGEFKAGEWCRFCRARGNCRARAEDYGSQPLNDPALLNDDELAGLLKRVDEIASWCSQVKEYALESALEGRKFNGFKVVESTSRRRIKDEKGLTEMLVSKGYDRGLFLSEPKMKPIGQLERAFGKKLFRELFDGYVEVPEGKPALVDEKDKRPVYRSAEKEFQEELKK